MKRKLFLALGIMLALAITGVSYAATSAGTSVTVQSTDFATVVKANEGPNTGSAPLLSATGTMGHVTAGDLYIIQSKSAGDIYGTLYLENASDLAAYLSYLNFNIDVYEKTTDDSGTIGWTSVDTSVLSIANGYVAFKISDATASSEYAISVDGGGFYIKNQDGTIPQPSFYVEIS